MTASTGFANMDDSSSIAADVRMRLDTYVRGECEVETLAPAMAAFCKAAPDAAWEVLAILDQYRRRGELDEELFQSLKNTVNRIAFGLKDDAAPAPSSAPAAMEDRTKPEQSSPTIRRRQEQLAAPEVSSWRPKAKRTADETHETVDDAEPMPAPPPKRAEPVKVAAATSPEPAKMAAEASAEPFKQLAPGDVLRDRYVIEAVLAYGQSSAVFKAYDKHRANFAASGPHVAVKVLHAGASDTTRAKFEQEFQLVQRLTHPNVVNVFDLDRDEQRLFFTMEWLEGQTLGQMMELAPPRDQPAFAIVKQIGSALAYMHDHGLVHGDVSPDNVMVSPEGVVKMLDFGSAVALTREPWISAADAHTVTKTAIYASCERLEGMPADKRDDVFSLACVAYELFTGEHPFFRQFATRARDSKQKPQRARVLSSRQWRTLLQGLAWNREQRPSIRVWLTGMGVELDGAPQKSKTAAPLLYASINVATALAIIAFVFLRWDFDADKTPAWLVSGQSSARQFASQLLGRGRLLPGAAPSSETETTATTAAPPGPVGDAPAQEVSPPAIATAPMADSKSSAGPNTAANADADDKKIVEGTGYIGFTKDTFFVKKTDSAARITVRRNGGNARAASFIWWAEPGTAQAEKDYISLGRKTEHLAAGERDLTVFVPLVSGVQNNAGEVFFVELESLDNASPGRITRARVVLSGE